MQRFLVASNLQEANIPRLRAALIIENEVTDTNPNGGRRKYGNLRRDKPLLYQMSSTKSDFAYLLSIFTHQTKRWREGREIVDVLWVDQEALNALQKKVKLRRQCVVEQQK